MADDYRKTYEVAAAELESLLIEQERIEERIFSLRKTLNVLSELIQQQEGSTDFTDRESAKLRKLFDTSITSDIEKVVSLASQPLTTSEIREELNKLGSLALSHSNPLATINAILNRLNESGRVKETVKNGRKAWERVPRLIDYIRDDSKRLSPRWEKAKNFGKK
jgi:hypothetical protein